MQLSTLVEKKSSSIHPIPEEDDRCPVFILDKYIQQVSHQAIVDSTCFYLKPLPNTNGNLSTKWYANQPLASLYNPGVYGQPGVYPEINPRVYGVVTMETGDKYIYVCIYIYIYIYIYI